MIRTLFRVAGGLFLVPLSAGCISSSAPAALVLPSGQVLHGSASSLVSGTFNVSNAKTSCYGSFEARLAGISFAPVRKAAVTATCPAGLVGTSQDALAETGRAELAFSDGRKGRLLVGERAGGL